MLKFLTKSQTHSLVTLFMTYHKKFLYNRNDLELPNKFHTHILSIQTESTSDMNMLIVFLWEYYK